MLVVLTGAAFLIFGQAFMVAPILPRLADVFGTEVGVVGLSVPAYLVPYGVVTLVWGPLADRFGRRPVILVALASFALLTAATLTATSVTGFIIWRMAAGAAASGVVPVGLALLGDVFAYAERGRAVGWLFGGMAGGMAFGSTAGALAEPAVGWRGLFTVVAVVAVLLLGAAVVTIPGLPGTSGPASVGAVARAYASLLHGRRARRTYGFVAFNAVLHSGLYTWLGLYLHQRFGLGPVGVGLGLLGYGIPGFVLGPLIGRMADRHGRARLIPAGVAVGAAASLGLAAPVPLVVAALLVAMLSLGYDLTQPLFAGIVTDLPGQRGQAVAFMAVTLFVGFGVGSLVFQAALTLGFTVALSLFGLVAAIAAAAAVPAFADEHANRLVHP
jgi:predicted MFS family arabinose efflux permease